MTLDLKVKMEADFIDISERLERAREKANAANLKVQTLETQKNALMSALNILAGKSNFTLGHTETKALPWKPIVASVDIQEGIIVEPGFKIGKDAQGNPVLVPIDINMNTTIEALPPTIVLPEIEDFASDLPGTL